MSDQPHSHPPMKIKILRAGDPNNKSDPVGVKKVAWPSLESTAAGGSATPIPLPSEPQVELLQQPDGKSKIILTCSCGKRVELICEM